MNFMRSFGRKGTETSAASHAQHRPETAATQPEEALNNRLARLRQAASAEREPVDSGAASGARLSESIADNAFFLLELDLDARQERIHEAVDDLSFARDANPRALEDARARLLSPRDRLREEMGWLPECDAKMQAEARRAAKDGDSTKMRELAQASSGLARLNLVLAFGELSMSDVGKASEVVNLIGHWDTEHTRNRLEEARARAGFKPVEDLQWAELLQQHLADLAERVAPVFTGTTTGQAKLIRHVQEIGGRVLLTEFFDAIQKSYSAGVEKKLAQLTERIDKAVVMIRLTPNDDSEVHLLTSLLGQWSSCRRPIQIMEAARSLDDQPSSEVFNKVKSLSVDLSNEHKKYDTALSLADALMQNFSHLPNCKADLERQMPVILGNFAFERLTIACANAKNSARRFAFLVQTGGLDNNQSDLVGDVVSNFELALENASDSRDELFIAMRNLAVAIHNVTNDKSTAIAMFKWMVRHKPSFEVVSRFQEDMRQLGYELPLDYQAVS